jgi:hypothetical protein
MPLAWTRNSHTFAAEYQISGIPFVITSADDQLEAGGTAAFVAFPHVSQFVVVRHTGGGTGALRVGFTENGVGATGDENYFLIPEDTATPVLPIRCKELWFQNDAATGDGIGFSLIAGMTNVEQFLQLTGSIGGTAMFEGVG